MGSGVDVDSIEGELLCTFACDVFECSGRHAQIVLGDVIHIMTRRGVVDHIAGKHGLKCPIIRRAVNISNQINAIIGKNMRIIFDVLTDFADGRVF